jgi:hypothetical protein
MKKPAALSAGLVAVKGTAAPVPDMPTRSPAAAPAPKIESTPLNFKLPDEVVQRFKDRARAERVKLNELFIRVFDEYCEKHGGQK